MGNAAFPAALQAREASAEMPPAAHAVPPCWPQAEGHLLEISVTCHQELLPEPPAPQGVTRNIGADHSRDGLAGPIIPVAAHGGEQSGHAANQTTVSLAGADDAPMLMGAIVEATPEDADERADDGGAVVDSAAMQAAGGALARGDRIAAPATLAPSEAGRAWLIDPILQEVRPRQVVARWDVTVRMAPPGLGEVRLRLVMKCGLLAVSLETSCADTCEALRAQVPALRAALQEAGVRLAECRVALVRPFGAEAREADGPPAHPAHVVRARRRPRHRQGAVDDYA